MSEILAARDALARVNQIFKPLADAEESLAKIGDLEQASAHSQERLNMLAEKRQAMQNDIDAAEVRINGAPGVVAAAREEADKIRADAQEAAKGVIELAQGRADGLVYEARKAVNTIRMEGDQATVAASQVKAALDELNVQLVAAKTELADTQDRIRKAMANAVDSLKQANPPVVVEPELMDDVQMKSDG